MQQNIKTISHGPSKYVRSLFYSSCLYKMKAVIRFFEMTVSAWAAPQTLSFYRGIEFLMG